MYCIWGNKIMFKLTGNKTVIQLD